MTSVLLDIRQGPEAIAWSTIVAGISLLERAIRLAGVCGAERVFVLAIDGEAGLEQALAASVGRVTPERITSLSSVSGRMLVLDVWTVYERAAIKDLMGVEGSLTLNLSKGRAWVTDSSYLQSPSTEEMSQRWAVEVREPADIKRAETRLWQDCRKPLDGIVSRHLNRYVSLWISARLARLPIHPNQISIVTFSLGILAGILASMGGYWGFFWAGVVFQINSIIDGCDGELARVKYEFSVTGEWLDTISDDLSDVFFWAGLGLGAWHSYDSSLDGTWWLWLAAISVVFKGVSMFLYYTWLYARGRGDLLAFTWSFDSADESSSLLTRVLKVLKYTTKKDFIVFAAMVLGFFGLQPWLLLAAAPGNLIVAISVILERRKAN